METKESLSLKQQIAQFRWYHSIALGNGVVTPGQDNSARKLMRLKLPASLAGKTVLDVGAWNGFFSFEAEKRGAQRVLATDSFAWRELADWGGRGPFDLARRILGSRVEDMEIDVLELSPERVGIFDLVLFLGVLYHMKHPLLALEKVAQVTREQLILETVVDMLGCRRPAMAFYAGAELSNDPTNWCGPNPAALVGMLRTVGFKKVEIVSGIRSPLFRLCRSAYYKLKVRHPFLSALRTDRMVVHAWK